MLSFPSRLLFGLSGLAFVVAAGYAIVAGDRAGALLFAAAPLVTELVRACPDLRVLALLELIAAQLLDETRNLRVVGLEGNDGDERGDQHEAGEPAWQPGGHVRLLAK